MTYFPHVFNDEEFIHGLYTIADEDLDIPAAYKQLEKYFNNVYGLSLIHILGEQIVHTHGHAPFFLLNYFYYIQIV